MTDLSFSADDQGEDLYFAAQVTAAQFRAVATRLEQSALAVELHTWSARGCPFKRAKNCDVTEVERWLKNAWNTERVLRAQSDLDAEAQRFALQWAFPQAYYATFCQVLALFHSQGSTEWSHTAVLRRFGELIREGRFPAKLGCYADGGLNAISFGNITYTPRPNARSAAYGHTHESDLASFLKSTREKLLREKKDDFKIKSAAGKQKKSFSKADWAKVAEAVGPTTVLSLLYRKRIKANYDSIDTFLDPTIDGVGIMRSLVQIVGSVALVMEHLQRQLLGADLDGVLKRAASFKFVGERITSSKPRR